MKLTTLISLLAIVTNAFASPAKRAQALQIQDFSLNLYSNTSLAIMQFTLHDPNTNLHDSCIIAWNTTDFIQPGLDPTKCQNNHFEFGFRYGIGNIENFTLVVQQVNGTEKGKSVVTSSGRDPEWICVRNPEVGVQERCVWVGVLRINV